MSDAPPVLVDGTRPAVLTDDGGALLLPSTATGTWHFAEVTAPTARLEGRPVLERPARPQSRPGRSRHGGRHAPRADRPSRGRPPPERIAAWSAQLLRLGEPPLLDDRFRFVPLVLRRGRMTLAVADGVFADPPAPVDVGGVVSVVATAALSPAGADTVSAAVAGGAGPPVGVDVDALYDLAVPACRYRVVADPAAVHAVLGTDPGALAGWLGRPASPAAAEALLTALRATVEVVWEARPAGFDEAATTAMEIAIRQRWLGPAAVALGAHAVPGTEPAAVALPPLGNAPDLDVTHDGGRSQTAVLRRGADLARLRGLGPGFVADVALDAASLPVTVTFPADDRVQQYVCDVAYPAADGHTVRSTHTGVGSAGLVVDEVVRWPLDTPRPATVTVLSSILWTPPDWPSTTTTVVLPTDRPTLRLTVRPASALAEVVIVTDLATAPVGALASISWDAHRPEGGSTGGSIVVEGAGPAGATVLYPVAFPRAAAAAPVRFRWTAELLLPDGSQLVGSGALAVTDSAEVAITAADLVRE